MTGTLRRVAPNADVETARLADQGYVAVGFEDVESALAAIAEADPDLSFQFCAYFKGRVVVDYWSGPQTGPDTLRGVFSATKGAAATCIGVLLDRGALNLDAPVGSYWPEFASGGKEAVTVRVALSHQAGIVGLEPQVSIEQLMDHDYMASRLAHQVPQWHPGAAHGYHGLTIGTLMDELVRRVDGRPIARFFEEEIAGPRGIDFYIASTDALNGRVVDILEARPPMPTDKTLSGSAAPASQDGLLGLAFNGSHPTTPPIIAFANDSALRSTGQCAVTGVSSARALAQLYAHCIGEVDGLPRLLTPRTVQAMSQLQATGEDLVLAVHSRYGVVFQKPDERRLWFGSHEAFGHDGAGGALGVADPWHDLAYGYIPGRMTVPGGADDRVLRLGLVLRQSIQRLGA